MFPTQHKSDSSLFSSFKPLQFYEFLFILSQWFKRHKRPYIGLYDKVQSLFLINGNSF